MQASSGKSKLKLYSYYKSSCAWRVRIALNLKGLDYEYVAVNLLKGEQSSSVPRREVSSTSFVASGSSEKGHQLPEWSKVVNFDPPKANRNLYFGKKASNIVAANIQPFQNLAVLNYIEEKIGSDEKLNWVQHHLKKGFAALEKLLKGHSGKYATGDEVALADLFLAPQIAATKRFNIDLAEFPLMARLLDAYSEVPAFQNAVPEKQPDALDS